MWWNFRPDIVDHPRYVRKVAGPLRNAAVSRSPVWHDHFDSDSRRLATASDGTTSEYCDHGLHDGNRSTDHDRIAEYVALI